MKIATSTSVPQTLKILLMKSNFEELSLHDLKGLSEGWQAMILFKVIERRQWKVDDSWRVILFWKTSCKNQASFSKPGATLRIPGIGIRRFYNHWKSWKVKDRAATTESHKKPLLTSLVWSTEAGGSQEFVGRVLQISSSKGHLLKLPQGNHGFCSSTFLISRVLLNGKLREADLGLCESWAIKSWVLKNWCFQILVLENTLESPLNCKEIKPVNPKGNQPRIFFGSADAEAEAPILWLPDEKGQLIGKDSDAGRAWRQKEKVATEDKMVRWHHKDNGHEFEQTPGDSGGQGSLACCSPWGCKQSGIT